TRDGCRACRCGGSTWYLQSRGGGEDGLRQAIGAGVALADRVGDRELHSPFDVLDGGAGDLVVISVAGRVHRDTDHSCARIAGRPAPRSRLLIDRGALLR